MKIIYLTIILICLSNRAFANPQANTMVYIGSASNKAPPTTVVPSAVAIPTSSENLYQQVSEAQKNKKPEPSLRVNAGIGIGLISSLKTDTEYFSIDYADGNRMLPVLNVTALKPIGRMSSIELSAIVSLGYATFQGNREAISSVGAEVNDNVSLQLMPVTVGTNAELKLSRFSPHAHVGVGRSWLQQSGAIDGINRSAWIPMLVAGMGVRIFEDRNGTSLFDGLDLGIEKLSGYNSNHDLDILEFKISTTLSM